MDMQIAMSAIERQPIHKKDQNGHILTGMIAAQLCFDWLEAENFSVIGMDIGTLSVPVIQIQTCAKCDWLARTYNAFAYKLLPVKGSLTNMMRVDIFGCRVEWMERGH